MKRIRITEKQYLLVLTIVLIVVSAFLFFIVAPDSIGYNLALSLISTSITVFFLDLMLIIREEKEWANVDKYIHRMIASELSILTGEIFRYLETEENETLFILNLSQINDNKIRSDKIINRLRELQNKNDLSPYAYDYSLNKESIPILIDVKKRLADLQIKYSNKLRDPFVVEKIQKIQDGIDMLVCSSQLQAGIPRLNRAITSIKQNLNSVNASRLTLDIVKNTNTEEFNILTKTAVEIPIKLLLNEIIVLWDEGITFNTI